MGLQINVSTLSQKSFRECQWQQLAIHKRVERQSLHKRDRWYVKPCVTPHSTIGQRLVSVTMIRLLTHQTQSTGQTE